MKLQTLMELFCVHIYSTLFLHLEWIAKTLRMMRKVMKPVVCLSTFFLMSPFSFIIYKSQTAVAMLMSFSSAGRRATTTLLLYLPLESSRTEVTPQKIACSGPFNSDFPQIAVAFVKWWESRPLEPPTVTLSKAVGWSHLCGKRTFRENCAMLKEFSLSYVIRDTSFATNFNSFD